MHNKINMKVIRQTTKLEIIKTKVIFKIIVKKK